MCERCKAKEIRAVAELSIPGAMVPVRHVQDAVTLLDQFMAEVRAWLPKCGSCGGSGRELTWDMNGGPPTRKCTDTRCISARELLARTAK